MWKSLLLLFFPLLISANIWDNLYDGQGVPFEFPFNSAGKITPTYGTNPSKNKHFNFYSLSDDNMLSVNMTSEIDTPSGATTEVLSQFKFNFTNGSISLYSPQQGCMIFHYEKLKMSFYYTMEGLLDLSLLINSQDPDGIYKKVDVSSIIKVMNISQCLNNAALYFLNDQTLKFLQTTLKNGTPLSFEFDNIRSQIMPIEEFLPHKSWKCKNMTIAEKDGKYVLEEVHGDYYDNEFDDLTGDVEGQNKYQTSFNYNSLNDFDYSNKSFKDILASYVVPSKIDWVDENIENNGTMIDAVSQMYQTLLDCNSLEIEKNVGQLTWKSIQDVNE